MKIFNDQLWHVVLLTLLLLGLYFVVQIDKNLLRGEFWGISTFTWFSVAVFTPIVHQLYVLICWRSELYYNGVSGLLGKNAFLVYKIGFALLILLRPLTILALAVSSACSFYINTYLSYLLSLLLFLPSVYLFYSVKKYFGMDRAFGIDHFYPEKFKNVPMVKKGIFKYTSNGMYIYGFLILWIPGVLLQSKAALVVALFNHLYIWVHYYFTELPDIKEIYK